MIKWYWCHGAITAMQVYLLFLIFNVLLQENPIQKFDRRRNDRNKWVLMKSRISVSAEFHWIQNATQKHRKQINNNKQAAAALAVNNGRTDRWQQARVDKNER